MIEILPLIGLMLPFLFWAVEMVFPYPYFVEEIGKAVFITLIWQSSKNSTKIKTTILMAVLLAFSESVFYLFNFSFGGSLPYFFLRLLLTTLLHTITSLIILLPTLKNKKLIILSLPAAMGIHYLYNNCLLLLNQP